MIPVRRSAEPLDGIGCNSANICICCRRIIFLLCPTLVRWTVLTERVRTGFCGTQWSYRGVFSKEIGISIITSVGQFRPILKWKTWNRDVFRPFGPLLGGLKIPFFPFFNVNLPSSTSFKSLRKTSGSEGWHYVFWYVWTHNNVAFSSFSPKMPIFFAMSPQNVPKYA